MGNEERIPLINATNINNNTNQHQAATLTWSHISVSCREERTIVDRIRRVQAKPGRILLNDLSGIARPGQILAVIGASGIGKTTLLNVLSGCDDPRTTVVQGTVSLNGYPTTRSQRLSHSAIGYVEQREVLVESMTLEEHLIFQVRWRKGKIRVKNFFRLFMHGLIEHEKLITNIYFLFRSNHCLPDEYAQQVE